MTIKTISLESVLQINLSFWILFYCENRERKQAEKLNADKLNSEYRDYGRKLRVFCTGLADLRKSKVLIGRDRISRLYMRYIRKTSKIIQLQFRTFLASGTRD